MSNAPLNFSKLGAEWYFNYNCNVIEPLYTGDPYFTNPQTEVTITGKFESFVIDKQSDLVLIDQWFYTGELFVYCPIFDTIPVQAGDAGFRLINGATKYGRFTYKGLDTPFTFGSMHFDLGDTRFKLKIRPVEKGYSRRKVDNKIIVDEIPFIVLPHLNINV